MYPGFFNKALHDISRDELFAKVWKIPQKTQTEDEQPAPELQRNILYRSMMDCELVLRFFGIRDAVAGKTKGSLRQIFDRTMQLYSSLSESQVEKLKSEFLITLQRVTSALGYGFHLLPDGQPSRPLYDAILVAADAQPMSNLQENAAAIKAKLEAALAEPINYDILVGRGNTLESIKERVTLATTILVG